MIVNTRSKALISLLACLSLAHLGATVVAQTQIIKVNYGYFLEARPIHVACARGFFDLLLPNPKKYEVTCFPQTSGGFAASRLDNGQLQIANLGSTPMAQAVARGIDVKAIYLSHEMGESQGIYVRPSNEAAGYKGVETPFDLAGRTLGVPFGSTMHYQVLFLIDLFGLAGTVNLLDLSPNRIIKAWDEDRIDAGACWGLARDHMYESGLTLLSAHDIANWGRPTFTVVAAQGKFAEDHSDFVTHFVAILSRLNDSYLDQVNPRNAQRWSAQQSAPVSFLPSLVDAMMIPTETKQKPKQATIHRYQRLLDLFLTLPKEIQASCDYFGSIPGGCERPTKLQKTIRDTAEFLLQQKVIASLGPLEDESYEAFVDGSFLSKAHRECPDSNCYRLGPYDATSGPDNLLAELELLDTVSGKSPFAAAEVGRNIVGDSNCDGLHHIFTGTQQGTFGDGANAQRANSSYSDNLNCNWQIRSSDGGNLVDLSISALRLWSGDFLRIYSDPINQVCDPESPSNVLVAQLSGFLDHPVLLPQFRSSGCLMVNFLTDSNPEKWYGAPGRGDGVMIAYDLSPRPCSGSADCSGYTCNQSTGLCDCGGTAFGADCSHDAYCIGTNSVTLSYGDQIVVKSSSSATVEHLQSADPSEFYPNDLDCSWDFFLSSANANGLKVTVLYDLEESHDLLTLQMGALSFGQDLSTYAVLTGTHTDSAQVYYVPSDGFNSLRLTTDARGRRRGFHAIIEAVHLPQGDPCAVPGRSGSMCEVDHCIRNNRLQEPAESSHVAESYRLGRVVSQVEGLPLQSDCMWQTHPSDQDIVAIRFVFNKPLSLEPKYPSSDGDVLELISGAAKTEFFIERCSSDEDCLSFWQTGECALETGGCTVKPAVESKIEAALGSEIHLLTDRNDGGRTYQGLDFDALLVQKCPNAAGLEHCENPGSNGKCRSGLCICKGGAPCACPCSGDAKNNTAAKVGLTLGIVIPLFLILIGGFLIYRRRKILASREQKRIIAEKEAELEAFRDSIVGICVCVREYVPTPQIMLENATKKETARSRTTSLRVSYNKVPSKVVWCWQETSHMMDKHEAAFVFGDSKDFWIIYDSNSTAMLEKAYQSGKTRCDLNNDYFVDLRAMAQTKKKTGFQRKVQRVVSGQGTADAKTKDFDLSSAHFSDGLPKELAGEPQMVLIKDDLVQISKKREDGWAFGTKMYHADEVAARALVEFSSQAAPNPDDANVLSDTGWFQEEATSVPTKEQLAALQTKVGGGANALDPPEYWEAVNDPTVAERVKLNLNSSEGSAVIEAFKSTLVPPRYKNVKIVSVERIQNLAMWQSYVVKRQTICYRDTEEGASGEIQKRAQQRVERRWLFHGTQADVMEKIMQQGFNRSFCGKNATMYGKGVYFARDAAYSAHKLYSVPDKSGYQYIMACRVVVGEYCKGVQDALTPRVRDAKSKTLYDSTVDSLSDPSIYVTYHDAQAYPEYLIQFRSN